MGVRGVSGDKGRPVPSQTAAVGKRQEAPAAQGTASTQTRGSPRISKHLAVTPWVDIRASLVCGDASILDQGRSELTPFLDSVSVCTHACNPRRLSFWQFFSESVKKNNFIMPL